MPTSMSETTMHGNIVSVVNSYGPVSSTDPDRKMPRPFTSTPAPTAMSPHARALVRAAMTR